MPEKDPMNYSLLTYAWVIFLSCWGGLVRFLGKNKNLSWKQATLSLLVDLITSAFVGVVTFLFCQHAQMDVFLSAALVGVSGHMGSRAIWMIESIIEKRMNQQ